MTLKGEFLLPRIVVNGFPKAGTHLASLLVAAMAKPIKWEAIDGKKTTMFGTFQYNSFSGEWVDLDKVVDALETVPGGTWTKGHFGYHPKIEAILNKMGFCMIFVYRDLRDVVVSMTYHIESDDDKMRRHAEKNLYWELPTHEERMIAVIKGIGHDPGLIARWRMYAKWLDLPWVLSLKYEDILADPVGTARAAVDYVVLRTSELRGWQPNMLAEQYDAAISRALELMGDPQKNSPTYRKGVAGEWRNEFTPAVKATFFSAGGYAWNHRMGYGEKTYQVTT